jgi:uncharacterized membrane protein YeiH
LELELQHPLVTGYLANNLGGSFRKLLTKNCSMVLSNYLLAAVAALGLLLIVLSE